MTPKDATEAPPGPPADPAAARPRIARLVANVERAVFGKRRQVELAVVGLLAEGHVLLEDVPGTGKTTLARALARSLDLDFRRIQFTSDLLPSDVLGVSVNDPVRAEFVFRPGPVFANVVLADELNRTIPRTQSALLECMNDRRVSVDGKTHALPRPFLVIATQNPLEFEGTYPLPESQLDRFLLRIEMGYPAREDERRVLRARAAGEDVDQLEPVLSHAELIAAIDAARAVRVDPAIEDYVLTLLDATRRGGRFLLGLSTRAGVGLVRAAQAQALLDGRDYCVPDDVKRLALPVLAHRIVAAPAQAGESAEAERLLAELLERTVVPA
jgi:MoxR-like ATPase